MKNKKMNRKYQALLCMRVIFSRAKKGLKHIKKVKNESLKVILGVPLAQAIRRPFRCFSFNSLFIFFYMKKITCMKYIPKGLLLHFFFILVSFLAGLIFFLQPGIKNRRNHQTYLHRKP